MKPPRRSSSPFSKTSPAPLLFGLLVGGVMVGMFRHVFFGDEMFAFRDVAHFYYPLFEYIQHQWRGGHLPLWNPMENVGQPLSANATSSVFYPPKLLFFLPFSYDTLFRLYILGHLLLAAATSYRFARGTGRSTSAAVAAALAYAFGGCVLFQYTNVVFLIGAAWIPEALLAAHRMLTQRKVRTALVFGLLLAWMVLGGDPQAAYHTGLLAAFHAFLLWRKDKRDRRQSGEVSAARQAKSWFRFRPVLLAASALTAAILAAVQILPSMEMSSRSDRNPHAAPHSLYSLYGALASGKGLDDLANGMLCRNLDAYGHAQNRYHFSVGPWRGAEYFFPNIFGRQFPTHSRWIEILPAEGRIWVPSFYAGIFTILLALAAMRWTTRKSLPLQTWLTWSLVLSVVASLGAFGPVWLVEEARRLLGMPPLGEAAPGGPVGGLYWWMNLLLPGYPMFRYPAKLLTLAAFPLSQLAAIGWDDLAQSSFLWKKPSAIEPTSPGDTASKTRRRLGWLALMTAAFCLGGLVVGALLSTLPSLWPTVTRQVPACSLFGPFQGEEALRSFLQSMWQPLLILLAASGILFAARGKTTLAPRQRSFPSKISNTILRNGELLLLVLLGIDLAVANGWMVATVDRECFHRRSPLVEFVESEPDLQTDSSNMVRRWYRTPLWYPRTFAETASRERLAESVRWDRASLWPKYPLLERQATTDVRGTMMASDFLDYANGVLHRERFSAEELSAMAAPVAVFPEGVSLTGGKDLASGTQPSPPWPKGVALRWPKGVALRQLPTALPRAWIVHRVTLDDPIPTTAKEEARRRTFEIFFPDRLPRDSEHAPSSEEPLFSKEIRELPLSERLRRIAVVEYRGHPQKTGRFDDLLERLTRGNDSGPLPGEKCRVREVGPGHLTLQIELEETALVVLPEQYWPGWVATGNGGNIPILRTNRFMRGLPLEAGSHRIVMRYRPRTFFFGGCISVAGWAVLIMVAVPIILSRSRRRLFRDSERRKPFRSGKAF